MTDRGIKIQKHLEMLTKEILEVFATRIDD